MKKKILATFVLLIGLSAGIQAQRLDEDCNPIAIPQACQSITDSIRDLQSLVARLQVRLREASNPNLKAALLRTLTRYNEQLDDLRADFRRCMDEHGATPRELAPEALTSRLTGTATLRTTDSEARGPFDVDLDIDLRFSRNRCEVMVTRFPSLKLKTSNIPGLGRVAVTVSKTGGGWGTYHPVSGTLNIQITLHFHYDTIYVGDDDATFNLTTGSVPLGDGDLATGSPLNADNRIILVGTATFHNGYLNRKRGGLLVRATISPRP